MEGTFSLMTWSQRIYINFIKWKHKTRQESCHPKQPHSSSINKDWLNAAFNVPINTKSHICKLWDNFPLLFCWTAEPRKLRSICLNAVDTEYWCDRTVKSVVFKHFIDHVIGIPFACIVDYNGTFYFVNPKYALNWEHTFLCIHWCFKKLFDFYMSSQVCSY